MSTAIAKRQAKAKPTPAARESQYAEAVRPTRIASVEQVAAAALEGGDFATAGRMLELLCKLEGHDRAAAELIESWKGRRARDRRLRKYPDGSPFFDALEDSAGGDEFGDDASQERA